MSQSSVQGEASMVRAHGQQQSCVKVARQGGYCAARSMD